MAKRNSKRRRTSGHQKTQPSYAAREHLSLSRNRRIVEIRSATFKAPQRAFFVPATKIKRDKRKTISYAKASTQPSTRTGLTDTSRNIWRPDAKITKQTKICLDRKIRREVLFANGKGSIKPKNRKHYTDKSFIRCK